MSNNTHVKTSIESKDNSFDYCPQCHSFLDVDGKYDHTKCSDPPEAGFIFNCPNCGTKFLQYYKMTPSSVKIIPPNVRDIPFYAYDFKYARDNGEEEAYKKSRNCNPHALEEFSKIVYAHYENNALKAAPCLSALYSAIGQERTLAILSATVNAVTDRWDKRYSAKSYEWATEHGYTNSELVSTVSSGLVNLLIEHHTKNQEKKENFNVSI